MWQVAFQCLHTLNCQQQHLNQLREDLLLHHTFHTSDNADYRSSSGESRDNNHREHSPFSPPGVCCSEPHTSISSSCKGNGYAFPDERNRETRDRISCNAERDGREGNKSRDCMVAERRGMGGEGKRGGGDQLICSFLLFQWEPKEPLLLGV